MHHATVIEGHGVASGRANDPRFPNGTLALQWPSFIAAGIDLNGFHQGTINLDFGASLPELPAPDHTIRKLKWHPDCPAEDFSLTSAKIRFDGDTYPAWLYYPHPETKPEHFQPSSVLEFLAPKIPGLGYGKVIEVGFS